MGKGISISLMNLRSQEGIRDFVDSEGGEVAFLRFMRGGLSQGEFSDWDIAVRDREGGMAKCEKLYGKGWLRIPRSYVIQHYYQWGQCDLLPVFEWNGFEYLDQDLFWEGVECGEDGIPRPVLGHDAYITWMTGLLWGGRFNGRYTDFIRLAAREDEGNFRECLNRAFGTDLEEKLYDLAVRGDATEATRWVGQMRFVLSSRCVGRAPITTIRNVAEHWWCELKFHWRLPFPWIAILGPDGSGKSTLIENLNKKLQLSRVKFFPIHWLPLLSQGTQSSGEIVSDPHARAPKSAFLSLLQLGKIFVYWWWASFRYLFHLRAKRKMVLSDRFYLDLLADPKRYRYGAGCGIARFVFRFLPQPDRIVVLFGSAERILARKQEVSEEELKKQLSNYEKIAKDHADRAVLVDCERAPEEVADEVLSILLEELGKRSR